jgi:hypothetical protein
MLRPTPTMPAPSAEWRRENLGLNESHPQVAKLAAQLEKFVQCALREDVDCRRWLVVIGPPRVGKTHGASAVRNAYNARRIGAWHAGWWGACGDIGGEAPMARFDRLCSMDRKAFDAYVADWIVPARLVVLDDVGSEGQGFKNHEEVVRLKIILDMCAREWPAKRRFLLVTTNVPESGWKSRWDIRIAERLREAARISLGEVKPWSQKK